MQTTHGSDNRILIVDDDAIIRATLREMLEDQGYSVECAANGWEAIQAVRIRRPDIILLDLMLPDLDGFGVCEILWREAATATIPIIIVSAWASADSRNLGLELGALDYITKPFSPQELVERVNRLLHARAS